jgi:hypothetical protein
MTTEHKPWWDQNRRPSPSPSPGRKSSPANVTSSTSRRHQIEVTVSAAELHLALGPRGAPVTFAFTHNALTLSTPQRHIRIPVRTLSTVPGTHTAGVRPSDADALRAATAGRDVNATLSANAMTLTLVLPDCSVTVGRW